MTGLLRNATHSEEIPVVFLYPKDWKRRTVIWVDPAGKRGLFKDAESAEPRPEVRRLLDAGVTVAGADLLYQGEFLADGKPVTRTRTVKNPREAAAYTFGYNPTLFAQRVHDILTLIQYIGSHERKSESIEIVGLNGAGPWVAAARVQAGDAVHRIAIDTGGFRFGRVLDIHDVNFLPGGAKYGDLPGMLALAGSANALLMGEAGSSNASNGSSKTASNGQHAAARTAVDWLLNQRGN